VITDVLLGVAALSCVVPPLAGWLRRRSALLAVVSVGGALVLVAGLAVLRQVHRLGPDPAVTPWVYLLAAIGIPVALSGVVFASTLGRESPAESLAGRRRTLLLLGAVGVLLALVLRRPEFLLGYRWNEGLEIVLGPLGKAYVSYLLVATVVGGYHLEATYRLGSAESRTRLRPAFLGLLGVLAFTTIALTAALLYGAARVDVLVAGALPLLLANLTVGYAEVRRGLSDAAVPVSRNVVYTSFTAVVVAVYVLGVGVLAQLASVTRWSPGQIGMVSGMFVVAAVATALFLSHRLQRRVRRFIDRNFYVDRHDYRGHWYRVTRSLDPAEGEDGVVRTAAELVGDVFRTEAVTVTLLEPATGEFRVRHGRGEGTAPALEADGSPVVRKLRTERRALHLTRDTDDFEYLPIYVEDREWLEATASRAVAPLLAGTELVGILGLGRDEPGENLSFEDLDLLDSIAMQVASVLRGVQLSRELASAREMELLAGWSNMLLHDLKNHLTPLRLLAGNLERHAADPEFRRQAATDIQGVAGDLERLVERLRELRPDPEAGRETTVSLDRLVQRALARLRVDDRAGIAVEQDLDGVEVDGDPVLLRRVIENLVTNAVEAMPDGGTLRLELVAGAEGGAELRVIDDGVGMDPAFVREQLFRPFSTTKDGGLGLGLYQCRGIVEAHGGEFRVASEPGAGTTFRLLLPGARSGGAVALPGRVS
jgi:putative PEP-CTERM system histidine kinase